MRITLLFLGSTGAGPVYSIEMAKALATSSKCQLQVVISKRVSNLDLWIKHFESFNNVKLELVDTYAHNKLSFALSLFCFWKINRVMRIIKNSESDFLYVPFLLSWDFLIYPRLYKRMKIIATLHDPHPHDNVKNYFHKWLQQKNYSSYKYVSDVIVLNKKDIPYVKENYCSNVHLIPHASFSSYVKGGMIDYQIKKTIGFIGRIEPYKGLDLLVESFCGINNEGFHLIIAGSGPVDEQTYTKIQQNNKIELINRYIDDDEFTGLINRMDFIVLPYKRASQSGVIPLVFAHGKTVIATKVGALEEQVPDGTGLIVQPTVEAIRNAIQNLYEDPQLIIDYGKKAKQYADAELTWDHSAKLLFDILEKHNE